METFFASIDTQLGIDRCELVLDRLFGEYQVLRDRCVGQPLRDQTQNVALAWRQAVDAAA